MKTPETMLAEGLSALGIPHNAGQARAFMIYLAELSRWGRVHNLTAIKDEREVVVKHFLDSALYLKAVGEDIATVADVGSGAGFPGLPMKILRPSLAVTLIEPAGKKCAFLRAMVRRLGLAGVTVLQARAREAGALGLDAACTRALYSACEFIAEAGHIVRPGGLLVLSKGPKAESELAACPFPATLMELELPFSDAKRTLIVIRKPDPDGQA